MIPMYFNIENACSGQFVKERHRRAGGIPETNSAIFMPEKRENLMDEIPNPRVYTSKYIQKKKIYQKSEKATNPVSNMSLVKDSAPATFPPFIGHS